MIVALDVPSEKEALALADELRNAAKFFKVGLQLYTAAGPTVVRALTQRGARVFLDLKLHDIPNTVASATQAAAALRVSMFTIHLSGGAEMVRAAVAAKQGDMLILGVTVLTSTDAETLRETGVNSDVENQVLRLAAVGVRAGVDGFVASGNEVEKLRARVGDRTLVAPGVRPLFAAAGDQKRIATPREAIARGADYIVVGRPITAAADPRDAFRRIAEEIEANSVSA